MENDEFKLLLSKIEHWESYTKKKYKYNTKTIEVQINQLRQDLHDLVQVLGCLADGYSELYIAITKIKEILEI